MVDAATRKASVHELHSLKLAGATVEVVSGPEAGLSVDLRASPLTIGAGGDCDIRLTDPLVSRRHLELRAEAQGVRLLDLGSTNGTQLHGTWVRDALLTANAVLTVGDSSLAVRLESQQDLPLSPRRRFGAAVGESAAMRHVFALLEQAAKSDVTVLLEGDSGTGKDVLAGALHQESRRAEGPFVVVDCGAIVAGLIESELFGHEKGAFTGAATSRPGAFEQADGGTLFLDEIGELPLESQPKLLRALESRSFRRVGGNQVIRVDVRVIAATNRRLRQAVRERQFREDLFYRLAVVHVGLPRLADRPDDIEPLAQRFLARVTGDDQAEVSAELLALLQSYSWPGNARELRNVVERFATFDRADARLLFGAATAAASDDRFVELIGQPYHDAKQQLMDSFHRAVLPAAVERHGSVAKAAEHLGLPRTSLYRMLQQLRGEAE